MDAFLWEASEFWTLIEFSVCDRPYDPCNRFWYEQYRSHPLE